MFNPSAPMPGDPGYGTTAPTSSRSGVRWFPSQALGELPSSAFPSEFSDDDIRRMISGYDARIATATQAWQETSGLQRRQIEAQIEDLKEGRENARRQMEISREIAKLQAETSRYGIDVGRQNALDQLQYQREQLAQNQQQFDARHGLDVAEAYTKYASTPDMRWAAADFDDAVARTGAGLAPRSLASRVNSGDRPQPKSWEQFSVLANYGPGSGSSSGGFRAQPMNATTDPMRPASGGAAVDLDGDGVPDPRVKPIKAIVDAFPPSETQGRDGQDWSALNAIESLYFSGTPGSVERLGKARQKTAEAGLARKSYDPELVREDYMRRRPGQGSVRAY